MDYQIAVNALAKYGYITCNSYRYYNLAKKLVQESEASVIEASWVGRSYDWEDAPDILKETTYSDCIHVNIDTKDNSVILNIVLFNGDMCYGLPTNKRCQFVVKLHTLPEMITMNIITLIRDQAELKFDQQEHNRRERQIDKIMKKMLLTL